MSDGKEKISYLYPATPNNGPRKLPKVFPFKISEFGAAFANAETPITVSSGSRNVYLRIKPKLGKLESDSFVALDDHTLAPLAHDERTAKKVSHRFKFTKIFDTESGQEEIFKETCHVPLTNFLHGGNCLVFAYGATNGGKTFTIQGSKNSPGIIPRAINLLFNSINGKVCEDMKFKPDKVNNVLWLNQEDVNKEIEIKQSILSFNLDKTLNKGCRSVSTLSLLSDESQVSGSVNLSLIPGVCPEFQAMKVNLEDEKIELDSESNNVYSVWVSYAEIYNENIYDLLQVGNTRSRKPLLLGENEQREVYIKGLTDVCVCSAEEAYKVFLYGKHNLRQEATSVNHVSSRSHSIFSIKLVKHLNIDCPMFVVLSMCTFVDLAGAERAKKTLNAGERMKESQCINTSLHVLGKCLEVLRHNQKSKENVCRILPARESKLTRLFQRALEGKEVFTMIVNINQDKKLFDETLNVLKFSAVAMELQYDRLDNSTLCSLRKSRFSQYMEKLSTSNQSSLDNIYECPEDSRYMKLLAYTEELRRKFEEEKKKNATLEIKVRREVYANCKTFMENMEKKYKERLKEEREMYAEYEEININLFKKYIAECYKRKHESDSEEEEEDDDEVEKDASDDKVRFLQSKVEGLTALLESAEQVKADHASLQAKYSKLEFELSTVKEDLAKAQKINMTMDLGAGAAGEVLKELQSQLAEQQEKLKEETKQSEEYKKLLEEAKLEYDEHFHEHEDFAARNAELEKIIAHKDEAIEDLQSQLNICNKKLTQQQEMVNTQEHSEKDMQDKLQSVCEARDEYKFKALQLECDLKKLQKEYSLLKSEPQERPSNNDVRALEALVASHEDQILKYKDKLKSQEEANKELLEEISVLKTSSMCSNQDSFEKEISVLQKEVKDSVKSKKELLDQKVSLEEECKRLQESLKAAESALSQEQANTKEMRKICEVEKESCASEIKELKSAINNLRIQHEKLVAENEKMKLENFELEETLRVTEEQINAFKTRRDAQFESYENMLKNERELRERDQREVYQMQMAMRNLTPNKNTHKVELEKLKDELKEAYVKISELEKGRKPSVRKVKLVRGKKATDENIPHPSEDELEVAIPEVQVKTEPEHGRSLRPRRKKVLYSSEDKESASLDFVRPKSSRRNQV